LRCTVNQMPSKARDGRRKRRFPRRRKAGQFYSPQVFDQPAEISGKCRIVMKTLQLIIFYRYKLYTAGTQYAYYIKIF